ncbi:MAG TPA: PEGA domain-containing protein [Patescibacteria group bacterium]|nr:PEGA domain-containing protein [Patescibacteria group bacterium]
MKRVFAFTLLALATIIAFGITVFLYTKNLGKGALQITSEPNSKVYLDGKLIGQTPLCKCEAQDMIDEGTYTVKLVTTEGNFPAFEQKIPINPKVLTVVDRTFADNSGSSASVISLSKLAGKNDIALMVISFPDKARVILDGAEMGQSPISITSITESDHELKLTKEGYKDKIVKIRTIKGYKLESVLFLAANLTQAGANATASASVSVPSISKVLILDTPTGFLRVRSEPSLAGSIIGQALPGEKYDLLAEQNGWFKIRLSSGKEGWVSSQYSQKQP